MSHPHASPPRLRRTFVCALSVCCITLLSGCDRTAFESSQAYAKGDFSKAFEGFTKVAQEGDADAQFTLGLMYFEGTGTMKDYTEAARWYRRAANQGQVMAQNNLGAMLMDGKGVAQDQVEAAFWFSLVANSGDSHAKQLRDSVATHLTAAEQDAVREKVAAWKPQRESKGWFK